MPRSFRLGADGFIYVDDGPNGEPETRLSKGGVSVVTAEEFSTLLATPAIKSAMIADVSTSYLLSSGARWFSDGTHMRSGSVSPAIFDATYLLTDGSNQRTAAQDAINAAIAGGFRDILFPAGDINVGLGLEIWGGVINILSGQPQVFGLRVLGAGSQKTRFLVGNGGVALWWHTANNLTNPSVNSQPSQMREFGGSGFSIVGTGVNSGAVGIRIGGKRPNQPDVMENKFFRDVLIDKVTSCWQDDDSTNTVLEQFSIGTFKYGFEHGYNCDNFHWISGYFGHEDPTLWDIPMSGVGGAGISTFTFPDAGGSDGVRISQKIEAGWVINAPGVFPHETYVKTVSSNGVTCTVTTQNYAGATVSSLKAGTEVSFFLGRVHVYGSTSYAASAGPYPKDSSPWTPPYWGQGKTATTQGRENGNALKHGQVCGGRIERFLDAGGGSHFNLHCNSVYTERISHLAKLGRQGGSQIPQSTYFVECYGNSPQTYTAPWVDVQGENLGGLVVLRDNMVDAFSGGAGVSGTQPWVSIPTYGSWTLVWENNALAVSSSGTAPQIVAFVDQIGPPSAQLTPGDCVYSASPRKGSARMLAVNQAAVNWAFTCQDLIDVRLNQALTVNNPFYTHGGLEGKEVVFKLTQGATGGHIVTFAASFIGQAGTALGSIPTGSANQVAAVTFKYFNNKFVLQSPIVWA